jgi:hypothetical protein
MGILRKDHLPQKRTTIDTRYPYHPKIIILFEIEEDNRLQGYAHLENCRDLRSAARGALIGNEVLIQITLAKEKAKDST